MSSFIPVSNNVTPSSVSSVAVANIPPSTGGTSQRAACIDLTNSVIHDVVSSCGAIGVVVRNNISGRLREIRFDFEEFDAMFSCRRGAPLRYVQDLIRSAHGVVDSPSPVGIADVLMDDDYPLSAETQPLSPVSAVTQVLSPVSVDDEDSAAPPGAPVKRRRGSNVDLSLMLPRRLFDGDEMVPPPLEFLAASPGVRRPLLDGPFAFDNFGAASPGGFPAPMFVDLTGALFVDLTGSEFNTPMSMRSPLTDRE